MPPLNDDRFDELLNQRLVDAQDDEALDLDADDKADLALMRDALESYKIETLHFTKQQSATMPAPRVPRVVALWDSTPRWAVTAAAVLALGCSSFFVTHHSSHGEPVTLATAPTATSLADDNRLLFSVDQALALSANPSEEDLGLSATQAHHTRLGSATN